MAAASAASLRSSLRTSSLSAHRVPLAVVPVVKVERRRAALVELRHVALMAKAAVAVAAAVAAAVAVKSTTAISRSDRTVEVCRGGLAGRRSPRARADAIFSVVKVAWQQPLKSVPCLSERCRVLNGVSRRIRLHGNCQRS